jgi:predicted methyltransferase MtxX (methanogen marker protein 4)
MDELEARTTGGPKDQRGLWLCQAALSSHVAADVVEETHMRLTVRSILLLIAVVLFLLAAVGIDLGNIALVPLGLAAFAAAFVVPDSVLSARR